MEADQLHERISNKTENSGSCCALTYEEPADLSGPAADFISLPEGGGL
ncbi:MAG: hypothetical protein LIO56_04910 [Lachnospiraceae bacterium]|nr:hypothetical protein [Lachnospiraceae bacterium]